jgi:hypothetical protein
MDRYNNTCPLSQKQLVDEYFIEYRAQILAVAAFLDRLDRSVEHNAEDEFRFKAFRKAAAELMSDKPGRVERVQMILSDPRTSLLDERDQQSAYGAFDEELLIQPGGDGQ